jgi:4-hydroxyacetophenone monooxygenase
VTANPVAAAVADGNIPVLLMVLVHLTGDMRWIEPPFTPTRNRGLEDNDSGGLSEALQAEVRAAATEAIATWLDGAPVALPQPSPDDLARMLAVAMGEPVPSEYGDMIAAELRNGQAQEPVFARPRRAETSLSAIVIGGGITGVCAAVALRHAGIEFTLLEANEDVGGVWWENVYPGVSVDTPSHLYSYSFAERDWSRYFASQQEILQYLQDVADRFDLRRSMRFGARVSVAVYDEAARSWSVSVETAAGDTETLTAPILIGSVGVFNPPVYPQINGLDTFSGRVVHTARWPADLDLAGARVAVIGNGASAMQLVPAVAATVEQLVVYQRSPQWVSPFEKLHQEVPESIRLLTHHVPLYRLWYRLRLGWSFNDRSHPAITVDPQWPHLDRSVNAISEGLRGFLTRYMEHELGDRADLLPAVTPDYPPYGKRILLDNRWYRTLARANVELVTDSVSRVTASGIVDGRGTEREADVIVLATGFDASTYLSTIDIIGRDGTKLADYWGDDPQAYLGVAIPTFPNFFGLYGPNTQPHGGSVIFTIEAQVRYMCDLLCQMIDEDIDSIECREPVWAQYNDELVAAHEKLVWRHGKMRTYFRNAKGRVVVLNPYRMVDVWKSTSSARLADYVVTRRGLDDSDGSTGAA